MARLEHELSLLSQRQSEHENGIERQLLLSLAEHSAQDAGQAECLAAYFTAGDELAAERETASALRNVWTHHQQRLDTVESEARAQQEELMEKANNLRLLMEDSKREQGELEMRVARAESELAAEESQCLQEVMIDGRIDKLDSLDDDTASEVTRLVAYLRTARATFENS